MIHYKKFDFTDFTKSPWSEKAFKNSCHESNTSNTNLPSQFINMDFNITSKSVRSSMVSTITRIYARRSRVQILDGEKELSYLKTSSSAPLPTMPPTQWKPQLFLWPYGGQVSQCDHRHPSRIQFKYQWSYTSIQPVCLHGTYWDNFIEPWTPTSVHITQPSSSVILHVLISGI
jgi:hypothetical protein